MSNNKSVEKKITMKDLKSTDPRWCTGCGDYTILVGLRKFMVNNQISQEGTVNISGIGCSGRIPHYMNTYGIHSIHGRSIPVAMGVALAKPELDLFIHSGDGDSLSIGGNHLLHGIQKNFNCVYIMFDNQIYGLTKNQTSPTTRQGLPTQSQPTGSLLKPINPIAFALGAGATFVASTAEWLGNHFVDTLDAAFKHPVFSFVHVAQRCPKFNPSAWNFQDSGWMTFLVDEEHGIPADQKFGKDASVEQHCPTSFEEAMTFSERVPDVFGLFFKEKRAMYDKLVLDNVQKAEKKSLDNLLDPYKL